MKKIIIVSLIIIVLIISFEVYKISKPTDWMLPPNTLFQNGTYSYLVKNENGEAVYIADLVVSNLINSKFDFRIIVARQNGVGEINGTTESLTPMSAQAKIGEFENICKLNFEVISTTTPISIKVTEDNCLEYHGASVQFEHQYIKTK